MISKILLLNVLTIVGFLCVNNVHLKKYEKIKSNLDALIGITPKTIGEPWPLPQVYNKGVNTYYINAHKFQFKYSQESHVYNVLTAAFNRYYKSIFFPEEYQIVPKRDQLKGRKKDRSKFNDQFTNELLNTLIVTVKQPCDAYPSLDSDESYSIEVSDYEATLSSKTVWGALRGLETFSQLIYENDNGAYQISDVFINDYPRFQHRGVLLDTSRHFLDKTIIKINLEAMAVNKFNVFHWHIVDDQSFPYQSRAFPLLSELGAYDSVTHVYTQEDIQDIVEFARLRGIRVIPEFDSPGHTLSWGNAIPILTPCFKNNKPDGTYGPIDPSNEATYNFLETFLNELTDVFPDKYLHLGGDEVDFKCWKSNPNVTAFMEKMSFGSDYNKLEQYYEQNLLNIIHKTDPNTGYVVWQEVIDNNVQVKQDTVVHVWKNPYPNEMDKATKFGYRTLLSSCWYLSSITFTEDWINYYMCDPHNFNGTDDQKKLVIGGEACLWGEFIDGTNLIPRTWPRASAVAERLWSAQSVNNTGTALPRLEEHRCRMIRRGIQSQPMHGPGFCNYEVKT